MTTGIFHYTPRPDFAAHSPIEWVAPALGHIEVGELRNPTDRALLAMWLEDACPCWLKPVLNDVFEKPRRYQWQFPYPKLLARFSVEEDAWRSRIAGVDPQSSRVGKNRKSQLAKALRILQLCAATRPEHGCVNFSEEAARFPWWRYVDNPPPSRHQVESLLLQRRRMLGREGLRHRDAWRPLSIEQGECDLLRRAAIDLAQSTDFMQAIDLHEAAALVRALALLACDFTTHSFLDVRDIAFGLSLFSTAQWEATVRLSRKKKQAFLERLDHWFWSYRGVGGLGASATAHPAAEVSFIWPDSPPELEGADVSTIASHFYPTPAMITDERSGSTQASTPPAGRDTAMTVSARSSLPLPGAVPSSESPHWRSLAPHPWLHPLGVPVDTPIQREALDPLQSFRAYFGADHLEVERLLKLHSNNRAVYLALKAGNACGQWLDHLYAKLDLYPGCVKASDLASNELEPYRFALEGGRLLRTTASLDRLLANTTLRGGAPASPTVPWPLPPIYVHFDTPLVAVYSCRRRSAAIVDSVRIAGAYVRPHLDHAGAYWIAPTVCVSPSQAPIVESFTTAFLQQVGDSHWQCPDLEACGSSFDRAALATTIHLSKVFSYWACEGAEYSSQAADPAVVAYEKRAGVNLGNEIVIGPRSETPRTHYGLGTIGVNDGNESGLLRWEPPRARKQRLKALLDELILTAAPASLVLSEGPGAL